MKNYQNYKKMYDHKRPVNRKWVDRVLENSPIWCSVDLRDGNQALPNPMTLEEKIEFFKYLIQIGFKEIEIGFPAASETEYAFTRCLIENNLIPEDVTIQVLTQSREEIINKTFESLKGAKNAVVHLYNSTSELQRRVVFNKEKEEVKKIATDGAKLINEYAKKNPNTNWTFEYSPESFTNTELDYALEVVNAVLAIWTPETKNKVIINLPATVESSTPNIFADQIEYMNDYIVNREKVVISIHPHNDRGTAVAASELALLAGADRVEGTLFGNGERTGNADILTIALNMYVLGIDPKLDFSDMNQIKRIYEASTKLEVSPRHPYAGEFVFTAFSGSHQDAISKGMKYRKENQTKMWEVPYLPINPEDLNRQYEPIIRINSQSGKGGVSYILEEFFGYIIPKEMKKQIGYYIKGVSDQFKRELSKEEIFQAFEKEYINREDKINLVKYNTSQIDDKKVSLLVELQNSKYYIENGVGNGPIDAFSKILLHLGYKFTFSKYVQHALEVEENKGAGSKAITYICILNSKKEEIWGIGKSASTTKSALKALISAINQL